ncbi:MAG: hypothetical protein E7539_00185 [Ruminococcaceae bacterium]|nr:hypothetical protein [Oscillospiraceae bacterium]
MLHNNVYHFFMSASTPKGFVTHFSQLTNENEFKKTFILKGGAGSGKSTLIKKAASRFADKQECELIHCSADVNSLDAAIFKDSAISLVDGTAPHVVEPTLAGLNHKVVSLYDFFDSNILEKYAAEINRAAVREEMYRQRFDSFLRAAGMLLSSNEKLAMRCLDKSKLTNFISRLCAREIKKQKGGVGDVKVRYLSTISENGVFMFTDTAQKMCDRLFAIEDDSGAASGIVLEAVSKAAVSAGYTVYICLCPMSDSKRIDHLLIPELSLGLMTSNKFHPIKIEGVKTIHTSRFYDKEKMQEYSFRTSFQRRAARELLKEAAEFSDKRLQCHRRLENYFVQACDFAKRDAYFDDMIKNYI